VNGGAPTFIIIIIIIDIIIIIIIMMEHIIVKYITWYIVYMAPSTFKLRSHQLAT